MSGTSRNSEPGCPDFIPLAQAVADGGGLRPMLSAAAAILGAGLAVADRGSAVLAVIAPSPEVAERLRSRGEGVERHRLTVAGREVGELRLFRRGSEQVEPGLVALVGALLALELERSRSGEWADEDEAAELVEALLAREIIDPKEIVSRTARLGLDLAGEVGVIIARVGRSEPGDQGELPEDTAQRALAAGLAAIRGTGHDALAALVEKETVSEIRVVAAASTVRLERAAEALEGELSGLYGGGALRSPVGYSRPAERPEEIFRSGKEALLALNVAEAEGNGILAFEETGSHRLLLSAMSENPEELEWFYSDTIAPLVAYDRQYGSDLVGTVEAFLRNDGNIAPTAEELFTHRHTVRYRLGRVHDLCGHDIRTTDGREQLGFGLKAMRVLGLGGGS